MKKIAWLCIVLMLGGCATPEAYQAYTASIQGIATARANALAAQTTAIMQLASGGDATTKTVAVLMLALQAGSKDNIQVEPPRNEALQWAQVLLPTVTALGMGYWGFQLGKVQSNNAASVSIAGYQAMNGIADSGFSAVSQFKPIPIDWAGIGSLQPNVTTNTSLTNTGNGVIGSGTADNRVSTVTTTTTTTDNSDRSDRSVTNPVPISAGP
jgi:hypothetical protein